MPTVFVIAQDWNLRATVRAELRELGVEALGMERVDDAARSIASSTLPDAVVLDASAEDAGSPAATQLARRFPVLLVASRTEPAPTLPAARIVWRPVRVGEIVECVRQLLEGRAA